MASNDSQTVLWISDFPIEWLPDMPPALAALPRRHPATWQMVLLSEFEQDPTLRLHVVLFRKQIPTDLSFERNGVHFHVLRASPGLRLGTLFWLDTFKIRRVCLRIQPDVVHAWGSEKGASLIASRLRWPYVMTIQGLFAWYKQRVKLPPYDRFVEQVERVSLRRAKVVTTESKFAVRFLAERHAALRIHQAEHAPNHAFHRVARRPQTAPLRFIAVGGLGARKGTDLIIRALDQLTGELAYTMTFITNPAPGYVASLQPLASAATWERIEFKENLRPAEVAAELATATMMLMPTRADTSPNAAKEAVVAGLPIVASAVGGIPDYVLPGKNGVLCAPDDLPAFVNALREACRHPWFSQGKVEAETLVQLRDYLSPETMARRFKEAYALALNRTGT